MNYKTRVREMVKGKKYLRVEEASWGNKEEIVICRKGGETPTLIDGEGNKWIAVLDGYTIKYFEYNSELENAEEL